MASCAAVFACTMLVTIALHGCDRDKAEILPGEHNDSLDNETMKEYPGPVVSHDAMWATFLLAAKPAVKSSLAPTSGPAPGPAPGPVVSRDAMWATFLLAAK